MNKFINRYGKVYEASVMWQDSLQDSEAQQDFPAGYWLNITEHLAGQWHGASFQSTSMSFGGEDKFLIEAESEEQNDYEVACEEAELYIDELIEKFQPKAKFTITQIR